MLAQGRHLATPPRGAAEAASWTSPGPPNFSPLRCDPFPFFHGRVVSGEVGRAKKKKPQPAPHQYRTNDGRRREPEVLATSSSNGAAVPAAPFNTQAGNSYFQKRRGPGQESF